MQGEGKRVKKEKMEKIVLLLIVSAGLIYAYTTYFLFPKLEQIHSVVEIRNERQNYYQQLLNDRDNLTSVQKETQRLEEREKELSAQIPAQIDQPQLMVDLYTLAKSRGVLPQSLAYESIQNKGTYQVVGLTFISLGKPADILGMIKDIQQMPKQKIAILSVNLSTQQGVMRAELKLTGYAMNSSTRKGQKPDFMNVPVGVDTAGKMFQP